MIPFAPFRNLLRAGWQASPLLTLLTFGFTLRLLLLWLFPVPYGEDAFGRLYFQDRIFLSHWLPLTQLLVYVPAKLGAGILFIRILFALLGSLSAYGFYLFLRRIVSQPTALAGGLLFSINALYLQLSLMPYQDVLFLGLFYAALGSGRSQESGVRSQEEGESKITSGSVSLCLCGLHPSLLFGLACLTRYESWFLIPVLVWWKGWRSLARSGLYFGWAPLLWLPLSQLRFGGWEQFLFQTASGEFFAWNPHFDLAWMGEYALSMLYWMGRFGSPILLLALPGAAALRHRKSLPQPLLLLFIFGALVAIFFFVIIGKEQDTVFRFSAIPLSIALVLAVLGLEESKGWKIAGNRFAAVLLLGLLVAYAAIPIYRLNQDPAFRDPYRIARFLENRLQGQESALVVANRSRELDDAAPIDYQRIVAQIGLPRRQILSAGLLDEKDGTQLMDFARQQQVRFLVIFEDFEPWLEADRFFAGLVEADGFDVVLEVERARVWKAGRGSRKPQRALR